MWQKINFKKLDTVSVLLLFFIVFIAFLFGYIVRTTKHIEKFSTYNNTVSELKSLNKDFDNLLLEKGNFINYDIINQSIVQFDEKIDFLNEEKVHNNFSPKYKLIMQDIIKLYALKLDTMERFKSQNAQFSYEIHYLYALNEAISKSKNIDKKSIKISNTILLDIVKYFMHIDIEIKKISNNINYLKRNNNQNNLIEIYIQHVQLTIKSILKFNETNQAQNLKNINNSLKSLHLLLNNNFQKSILIDKIIITILFALAIMVLILLFIINRNATRMKDELFGFRTAVENSYNSIIITDLDKNIIYVNEMAQKESGYTKEELMGNNPRLLKSGLKDEKFYAGLHDALDDGQKWEGEFINKKKDGSLFYEKSSIMPIYQNGKIANYLAIKLNITDYVQEQHKVEYMAYHDALTSLPNRLKIEEYLKECLPLAKQNSTTIAILFIDLDRFKTINDTLGHEVGDELLIECAKRMRTVLGNADILARFGGDEFIIVIEQLDDVYTAAHIAEKILKLFSKPVKTNLHLLNITLSIGIAMYPDDYNNHDDLDYQELLKYADIAMYEAKAEGRNTYRYYRKELSLAVHERLHLEQNLKISLEKNELYMVYQPQYNLITKEVTGMEALVRWNSKQLGKISPDIFIPVAEDTGFIVEIGLFIFEQACKDFLVFQEVSKTLQDISINISAVQLYQKSFINDIISIIDTLEIHPKYIKLEITETHIMKNIIQSKKVLNALKKLGFHISIDDFGTGHSSLRYLKEFPISELKIDKTFIDNLPYSKNNVAISKSIMTLSHSMGYTNVAEGIEREEQELFLKEYHCLTGQGFYFCKPLSKMNLIKFLESK